MGEVAETMMKKKKKGRPSLLDLQKRALKQQQLQQQQQGKRDESQEEDRSGIRNPNSGRRSSRRSSNLNGVSPGSAWIDDGDDKVDVEDDERREKKHMLLHGLNSHVHRHSPNSQSAGSDLNHDDPSENPEASVKRRKIGGGFHGSDDTGEKGSIATGIPQDSPMESEPTTPLPDKKLLVFILDRLQKKDTYGVFSDPVDPKELPDYHEIIANPMDFSTVRKKLDSLAYANLEQFERDVFLICTNAMEYNSPDTIYFRQARAMHEIAKKDFENLRRDSDDEEPQPQHKVAKRGRPPGKSLKKQPEPSSIDPTTSEISAEALITAMGDSSKLSGAYNLRKAPNSHRFRPAETSIRLGHHSGETQSGWSIDWENEFPSSVVKAVNKYGMKHVDENRRDTYNQLSASMQEPSVLTTIEDESKQLIPVGLNTEYGYARSLARYAANLGPVAWKIALRRVKTVLPPGIGFGPGWIGENPAPEDPQEQIIMSGNPRCSNDMVSDDHVSRILSPTPSSVSHAFIGNRHSLQEGEESLPARMLNPETKFSAGNSMNHMTPSSSSSSPQIQQSRQMIDSEGNGLIRGFSGLNHNRNQMLGTALSRQGSLPFNKQEFHQFPPDLNARLVSPSSPTGQTGSSQNPDLALQL
ncbi:PREDICTED: bromodomain-containing protein 9 [Tarenaya hassleriana]|uniref:bromodomain-containing protein 9 n=1 Tax=Tarenaya hassleriana TaxID=28532 RepID=UPI00053C4774|nr:PREDICTED: bromodomain-containing protein 9 [Tarenaya hassleriana]